MGSEEKLRTAKQKNHMKIIKLTVWLIVFSVLFACVTYSWIKRQWQPEISQNGIKIEAGGSLTFKMNENEPESRIETLNSILGMDDFVLKPVSNLSGKSEDFFNLNRAMVGSEYFVHLTKPSSQANWMEIGKTNGYFEAEFSIMGNRNEDDESVKSDNNYTKFVFFNNASRIEIADGEEDYGQDDAIRISMTVKNLDGTSRTFFLRKRLKDDDGNVSLETKAITNKQLMESGEPYYIANGVKYYKNYFENPDQEAGRLRTIDIGGASYSLIETHDAWAQNQTGSDRYEPVREITYYNGGFSGNNVDSFGLKDRDRLTALGSRSLFTIAPDGIQNVTLRIWLEGEDVNCKKEIAGKTIDFLLRFDCVNISNDILRENGLSDLIAVSGN